MKVPNVKMSPAWLLTTSWKSLVLKISIAWLFDHLMKVLYVEYVSLLDICPPHESPSFWTYMFAWYIPTSWKSFVLNMSLHLINVHLMKVLNVEFVPQLGFSLLPQLTDKGGTKMFPFLNKLMLTNFFFLFICSGKHLWCSSFPDLELANLVASCLTWPGHIAVNLPKKFKLLKT